MPILQWLHKDEAVKQAGKTKFRLLKEEPTYSYGVDSDNMIIQGDNLEALKSLLPYYKGQVKCIYIDPPYNTGNAFEHYDDNLEHSTWLTLMYPRLELLREFLREDGSIWVSIDDDESHYLKVMMDEIFGRKNFVANIVWQKKYGPANDAKYLSDSHEHILMYSKNKLIWKPNLLERTNEQLKDYKNPDNDLRGLWRASDLSVRTFAETGMYKITGPNGKEFLPPPTRAWAVSKERFQELVDENRIWWGVSGDGRPMFKKFLSEVKQGITVETWWDRNGVDDNKTAKYESKAIFNGDSFATPKPERLLQRIIHIASNPGDLVLDSFLGSGTTVAVAHKMGRQYIGIEMGTHAVTHIVPRIKQVIDGTDLGGISVTAKSKAVIQLCKKCKNSLCEDCSEKVGSNSKGGTQVWFGGGGYKFYTLGNEVYSSDGQLNSAITFRELAAYIWFNETQTAYLDADSSMLGNFEDTSYYLLYDGSRAASLNLQSLNQLPEGADKKVIYADLCTISKSKLKSLHITFKQIPYELTARR